MKQVVLLFFFFISLTTVLYSQTSGSKIANTLSDSVFIEKNKVSKPNLAHSPRKATIRSAIIPGWGQAYNKKYWKIPIVYAAIGTAAGFFIFNNKEYIDARDAYRNMMDNDNSNNHLIKPKFRPVDPEAVRQYRIGVRQNVDYSVLAFVLLWGLNVVDATVDGHLKAFEVNDNLSLHINPKFSPQTKQATVGLVLNFRK